MAFTLGFLFNDSESFCTTRETSGPIFHLNITTKHVCNAWNDILHAIYSTNIMLTKMKIKKSTKYQYRSCEADYSEYSFILCAKYVVLWMHVECIVSRIPEQIVAIDVNNAPLGAFRVPNIRRIRKYFRKIHAGKYQEMFIDNEKSAGNQGIWKFRPTERKTMVECSPNDGLFHYTARNLWLTPMIYCKFLGRHF